MSIDVDPNRQLAWRYVINIVVCRDQRARESIEA